MFVITAPYRHGAETHSRGTVQEVIRLMWNSVGCYTLRKSALQDSDLRRLSSGHLSSQLNTPS
jgi:hypothetical protein